LAQEYNKAKNTAQRKQIIIKSEGLPNLTSQEQVLALYQERAVFGKRKMDLAKRDQTQNAGEVSWLQRFFSLSVELMTDKVWLHCIRPVLLK
jgi:hypothetical protein